MLLTASILLAGFTANAQAPKGEAARGKDLFQTKYMCYTCHGHDANGGAGVRLIPVKMSQVAFTGYVRNPARMPAYSPAVLSDQELADIWAYLKTFPDAKAAKDIPLLNEIMANDGKK